MKKYYNLIWHKNDVSWIYDTYYCTEKEISERVKRYNENSLEVYYTYEERQ